jgi:hypothetical protein
LEDVEEVLRLLEIIPQLLYGFCHDKILGDFCPEITDAAFGTSGEAYASVRGSINSPVVALPLVDHAVLSPPA